MIELGILIGQEAYISRQPSGCCEAPWIEEELAREQVTSRYNVLELLTCSMKCLGTHRSEPMLPLSFPESTKQNASELQAGLHSNFGPHSDQYPLCASI